MTKESKQRAEQRKRAEEETVKVTSLHPLDPAVPEPSREESTPLEWDASLLLLIPLRLGLERFNPEYVNIVARTFSLPQSVGILGGRPRGARWFYGAYSDGSKVLGLDPHTVQLAPQISPNGTGDFVHLSDDYVSSVHAQYPEAFDLFRVDPSIALGFYCRDRKDFESLEQSLKILNKNSSSPELVAFMDKAPDYLSSDAVNDMFELDDGFANSASQPDDADCDEEDYVLL
jgi:cysteine protease ATG4